MEIPKRLWIGIVILGACARLLPLNRFWQPARQTV